MQTQRRDARPRGGRDSAGTHDQQNGSEGDPIMGELRRLYDGIVEEPVPDQLMDLLRKLDEIERRR